MKTKKKRKYTRRVKQPHAYAVYLVTIPLGDDLYPIGAPTDINQLGLFCTSQAAALFTSAIKDYTHAN